MPRPGSHRRCSPRPSRDRPAGAGGSPDDEAVEARCVGVLQLSGRRGRAPTLGVAVDADLSGCGHVHAGHAHRAELLRGDGRIEYGVGLIHAVDVGVHPGRIAEALVVGDDHVHTGGQHREQGRRLVLQALVEQLRRGALVALADGADGVAHQRSCTGAAPRCRRLQQRAGDRYRVVVDVVAAVHDPLGRHAEIGDRGVLVLDDGPFGVIADSRRGRVEVGACDRRRDRRCVGQGRDGG